MTGLRCIRCLADVLRTGAPKPGCSYSDPTHEAKYVVDGESVCDAHARDRLAGPLKVIDGFPSGEGPLKPIDPDAEVQRLAAQRAERPEPRRFPYPIGGLSIPPEAAP